MFRQKIARCRVSGYFAGVYYQVGEMLYFPITLRTTNAFQVTFGSNVGVKLAQGRPTPKTRSKSQR